MHAQDILVRELRAAYKARSRDARRFWIAVAVIAGLGLGMASFGADLAHLQPGGASLLSFVN